MGLLPILAVGVLAATQLSLVLVLCHVQHSAAVRRRRAAFGPPPETVTAAREGSRITLEGTLESLGSDGSDAVVLSCRAGRGTERARAAAPLVLVVGDDRVALDPDVDIVVGSHERVPRDDEGRPDLQALVREICAGDHVLVRGVLRRASASRPGTYRRNAIGWTLRGEGEPIRLAFDGRPRLSGSRRFLLAAVPSGWFAAGAALAVVGASAAAGTTAGAPSLVADPPALGPAADPAPFEARARDWLRSGCATEIGAPCAESLPEAACVDGRCEVK